MELFVWMKMKNEGDHFAIGAPFTLVIKTLTQHVKDNLAEDVHGQIHQNSEPA